MDTVSSYINNKFIDVKSVKMVRFDKSLSKYTDLLLSMCEDLDILHNKVFDKPSITELSKLNNAIKPRPLGRGYIA